VFRASVSESSVNEYRYPDSGEHDVGSDSADLGERHVNAVSESSTVEFASDSHHGGCVHVPHSAHVSRFGGRGWHQLWPDPGGREVRCHRTGSSLSLGGSQDSIE
jgi:hypothetical protein